LEKLLEEATDLLRRKDRKSEGEEETILGNVENRTGCKR
jgi:hypothetical protein